MLPKLITRLPVEVDPSNGVEYAVGAPLWLPGNARTGRLPDSVYWRIDAALQARAAAEGGNAPVGLDPSVWLLRCARCQAPFIGPSEAKMCSDQCRIEAKRACERRASAKRTARRKAALAEKWVICRWCGAVTPATRATRRFCGDACRIAGHRAGRPATI
jgi:hypothetical protein